MKDISVRWALARRRPTDLFRRHRRADFYHRNFPDYPLCPGPKFALPRLPVSRWFVWSGIFTGGSFLLMYLAFSMERVTIVAPLMNSYTVFVRHLHPLWRAR